MGQKFEMLTAGRKCSWSTVPIECRALGVFHGRLSFKVV